MITSAPGIAQLINPVGWRHVEQPTLARRLSSLEGKSIGFIDNHKPNADHFLGYIRQMICAEYPGVTTHTVRKNASACYLIANELQGKVDAVVNAWGD